MTARNFLVLIGSQILATIGGIITSLIALFFMGDLFNADVALAKLITFLLLGGGFLIFGSSAASYVVQVSTLPLSIAFLITSAIGSFILLPMTDILSIVIAASISVFSIILIAGVAQIGEKPVNMYMENISISRNAMYFLLSVEVVIVTTITLYLMLTL